MASIRSLVTLGLAAAVTFAGCGTDDDEAATTTTTSSTTSTTAATTTTSSSSTTSTTAREGRVQLTQSCVHDERDVRVTVRYPQGWHANEQGFQPCGAFDPEPFELTAGTEFPRELAVVVRVEPLIFDQAGKPIGLRIDTDRRTTVDGRQAARQEVVTTGEGLAPAGLASTRYVIDGGPERVIIASTYDVEGNDYERSVDVLDAMVEAFEIEPRNG